MTQTNLTPAQLKALTYGALLGQAQVGFAKGGARARLIAGLARRGLVDEYLNITAAGYAAIGMRAPAEGATVDQIAEETGWQRHTIRGAISTMRSKRGLPIQSVPARGRGETANGSPRMTTKYRTTSC